MKKVIINYMKQTKTKDRAKSRSSKTKTKSKIKTKTKTVAKTKHGNTDQKKEIEKKNEGPILYAVSQRNKRNVYNPIALLDQEGHFRGTAIFESKKEAIEYLERYNQVIRNKGKTVNLKIIEQHGLPPVNRPAYILSSQKQQPQEGQGQEEQNENNNSNINTMLSEE
jgi:hypothetical protein